MGSHKKSGRSTPAPPRSSTAPPERSQRPSRRPAPTLAPLNEAYDSLNTGYSQGSGYPQGPGGSGSGSGSQQYQSLDELYNLVTTTESSSGSSSRSKSGKKRSSRSTPQRYSATPAPQSSYRSPGSSSSSQSGWALPGPSTAASSSYYSGPIDTAEAAAMRNTSLYQTDGTMNPMLAPFVATGLEGVEEEPEQEWVWNPLLNRYTHKDERSQQVMFLPKPDSFP